MNEICKRKGILMLYWNEKNEIRRRGFSVVEVLVALGFVAIIGAGLASVMTSANKQQKGVQAKDQQREITAELRNLLSDRTACLNSFGGIGDPSGTGFPATSVKDAFGVDRYNTTTLNLDKTNLLQFNSFDVSGWTAATSNAILRVKLSKTGVTGTARDIFPDIITLKVKRDGGTGFITECFSIGTVSDSFWKIATDPSDIYFDGGKVGIGMNSPTTEFHVRRDQNVSTAIRLENRNSTGSAGIQYEIISSNAAGALGINGNSSNWGSIGPGSMYLYNNRGDLMIGTTTWPTTTAIRFFNLVGPAPGVPQDLMRLDNQGRLGIGTTAPTERLHVVGNVTATGSVKPGSATVATMCAPVGAFSYDPGSDAPLFCNNSNVWTVVGGGGTVSIDVWRCQDSTTCDDGQVVTGSWASYGCLGQVTSVSVCRQMWFNGGSRNCINACTYIGKLRIN